MSGQLTERIIERAFDDGECTRERFADVSRSDRRRQLLVRRRRGTSMSRTRARSRTRAMQTSRAGTISCTCLSRSFFQRGVQDRLVVPGGGDERFSRTFLHQSAGGGSGSGGLCAELEAQVAHAHRRIAPTALRHWQTGQHATRETYRSELPNGKEKEKITRCTRNMHLTVIFSMQSQEIHAFSWSSAHKTPFHTPGNDAFLPSKWVACIYRTPTLACTGSQYVICR